MTALGTRKSLQLREWDESILGTRDKKGARFLATKVGWVDAQKVRDSLYLTQLMRSPAQASVNVLVHEDPYELGARAKYKAMESASSHLRSYVDAGVRALEAGN